MEFIVNYKIHISKSVEELAGYFARLLIDKVNSAEEALLEIYKRLRPGEPPAIDAATGFFDRLFFNPETYDLSEVGRLKINHRYNISFEDTPVEHRTLTKSDII